jgi:hypothetical protein
MQFKIEMANALNLARKSVAKYSWARLCAIESEFDLACEARRRIIFKTIK